MSSHTAHRGTSCFVDIIEWLSLGRDSEDDGGIAGRDVVLFIDCCSCSGEETPIGDK